MDPRFNAAIKARTQRLPVASGPRETEPPSRRWKITRKKPVRWMPPASGEEGASSSTNRSDSCCEGDQIRHGSATVQDGKHSAKRYFKLPRSTASLSCLLMLLNMLTSRLLFFCIDEPVPMIWAISFLLCLYMFICIASLTLTMWPSDVILRFITPLTLACLIRNIWSSFAGMFGLYLTTGYAAGLLGYTFAERDLFNTLSSVYKTKNDMHDGVASPPAIRVSSFLSLLVVVFGMKILWVFCNYTPPDATAAISELSVMAGICLFMWTFFIHEYLLNESVITFDAFSILLSAVVVGFFLFRTLFVSLIGHGSVFIGPWLTMMVLAGFLGYSLAIYHCYKGQLRLSRSRVNIFVESVKSKIPLKGDQVKKQIGIHELEQLQPNKVETAMQGSNSQLEGAQADQKNAIDSPEKSEMNKEESRDGSKGKAATQEQ